MKSLDPKRFSIALSFPSDKRYFVEQTANYLSTELTKDRVLYDQYYEDEFARIDLDIYLPNLYLTESELIVIFLCSGYKNKRWCGLELRSIRQLIATPEQNRIMLLNFDENENYSDLGILPGDGYLSIKERKPEVIADLILKRLSRLQPQSVSKKSLDLKTVQENDDTNSITSLGFHGSQRQEIINSCLSKWKVSGPAVSILYGISGIGKTQVALEYANKINLKSILVTPQHNSPEPISSFFTDISEALKDIGVNEISKEMDDNPNGDLFNVLLRTLRSHKVLIIIDDFQNVISSEADLPPPQWRKFIENLNNSINPNGRLLLISNRTFSADRWNENCHVEKLEGLSKTEAGELLNNLLKRDNLQDKIPTNRLTELGERLGGNPRAIKTLAASLKYSDLDDLISLDPDLFKIGDVNIAPELVVNFERALIEHAIPSMDADLLNLLELMSVFRRPFSKEAYISYAEDISEVITLRKKLIERFLWDTNSNRDSLHPLAREICINKLRVKKEEWAKSHAMAANYYLKLFKTSANNNVSKVTASYSELRHHLYESGRMNELHRANIKLTKYALNQIPKHIQSSTPKNTEILEEHIALISSIPDDTRSSGFEYHLALCLKKRNTGDDLKKALVHVRKAINPNAYYATWLLLIELEHLLNGVESMKVAQAKALKHLKGGNNSFAVYLLCAELLVKDDRYNEAIELLKSGINEETVTCLATLITRCVSYMEQAGRINDAIKLLSDNIDNSQMPEYEILYVKYASLLTKVDRQEDAITLLKSAIKKESVTRLGDLYGTLAKLLIKTNQHDEASKWFESALNDSRVFDLTDTYLNYVDLLITREKLDEALEMLEKGIHSNAVKNPLQLYHKLSEILATSGKIIEATTLLKGTLRNETLAKEPSIYLTCAKIYFKNKQLDEAINILKQGLQKQGLKEKGQIYVMTSDYLQRQGKIDEAISLLLQGINDKREYTHFSLYQSCADLMTKAGRMTDAVTLIEKGIESQAQSNKAILYQTYAKLLEKCGHTPRAIEVLKGAIKIPGIPGKVALYQACASLLTKNGLENEAIKLLKSAFNSSKLGNLVSLYQQCAEIMYGLKQHGDALSVLNQGLIEYPNDKNLKLAISKNNL